MKRWSLAAALLTLLTLACIHVVVNVYFPETEAKGALATLEDELLKGSPAKPPAPPAPESPAPAPQPSPAPEQPQPPAGTRGFLLRWLTPEQAYAAGPVTETDIFNQIKSMPEVRDAYQRMAGRLARVDRLRSSGLAGEGMDGHMVARQPISDPKEQRTIDDENRDRTEVIRGLARATLLAQGLEVSDENLARVLDGAANTFAELRRDRAQPGWWIQMPDGTWKKK